MLLSIGDTFLNIFYYVNSLLNSDHIFVFIYITVRYYAHINCGGEETTIGRITYEGDEAAGGAAKYVPVQDKWEVSTTGHFWVVPATSGDYIARNVSVLNMSNSELYTKARLSPLSLTYHVRCLANGSYTVKLHFAEIIIRDNRSFHSLGRRIFDVYIQVVDFLVI